MTAVVVTGAFVAARLWGDWHHATPVARDMESILFAFAIMLAGLVILLVFTREEVVIGDGVLERRNLLGVPSRYSLDAIGGVARRDVTYLFGPPSHYVIVYDEQHRCLFKMNRVIWDPGDVNRLHARLGGDGRTRRATMSEVEAEFPGSIAWLITHPWVLIALELVVLLGVLFALVSIQDAIASRL